MIVCEERYLVWRPQTVVESGCDVDHHGTRHSRVSSTFKLIVHFKLEQLILIRHELHPGAAGSHGS